MTIKPLLLATLISLSISSIQAADIKTVDSIVAVADNSVITQRELNQAIAAAKAQLPKGTQPSEAELRRQVLAQLINQALLVEAGQRRGISAMESEVDQALAAIAYGSTTVEKLYAQAARNGSSKAEFRRNIARNLVAQKVQQQAIMENARVSDAEVEHFIRQAQAQGIKLPEGEPVRQYHARHILLKADSNNTAANAAAEAGIRKIYDQARSGTDFAGLARQFSQDTSATNGGDLGWFTDGQMVAPFEQAVHQLKPGQISRPVRTPFGWHIIKLEEVRDAGTPEEQQRNAVRQYLTQQKVQQATTNLLQQLHQSAYVDIRTQ